MKNETKYTPVYESKEIQTNDTRKTLTIQTVVGSNGTLTVNMLQRFKSDKKDSEYVKAIAFNVTNENMKLLVEAFVEAQKVKASTEKKDPTLQARPKETASTVKTVTGQNQIEVLKSAGMTEAEIKKVLARKAKENESLKVTKVEATEDDIFTQAVAEAVRIALKGGKK